MMHLTSESVEALVEQFARLPGIGRKTAQRLAAHVLKMPREEVAEMARVLVESKDRVQQCSVCFNVTDHDPCAVCTSAKRDHGTICVVEEPNDVLAVERTHEYFGVYHVLGGVISPLDGIGPDELRIRELIARIGRAAPPAGDGAPADESGAAEPYEEVPVREVILALNPNVEGDTTAIYLTQLIRPLGTKVTRIARGLPIGGDLEYVDEATLARALEGRATS